MDQLNHTSAKSYTILDHRGVPMTAEKSVSAAAFERAFGVTGSGMTRRLGGPTNPFSQVNWVYACMLARASAPSRVPLRVSRGEAVGTKAVMGLERVRWGRPAARKTRREKDALHRAVEGEIIESGELVDLLRQPNPDQRWKDFAMCTIGLLDKCGRAHWIFDEMVGRRPLSMYAVSGAKSLPVWQKRGMIQRLAGWRFSGPDGQQIFVSVDECVTFQSFNPDRPIEGLSLFEPASLAIISYHNADVFSASMFANDCTPGGVLTTEATFNPDADETMKRKWAERHGGPYNAREIAILWGGLKYESIASTMNDMQGTTLTQMKREDICAVFRVPASVAGFFGRTGDASAYLDAELERFWQDTAAPLAEELAEAVAVHIAPRFAQGLDVWADVESVPTFQRMRRAQTDTAQKYFQMGRPWADINDWLDLGWPERPWDQTGFVPAGLMPADQAAEGVILPPLDEGLPDQDSPAPPEATQGGKATQGDDVVVKDVARRTWDAWQRSWAPLAKVEAAYLRSRYMAQMRQIVRMVKEAIPASLPASRSATQGETQGVSKDESIIARILLGVFENRTERAKFLRRMTAFQRASGELGVRQVFAEAGMSGAALDDAVREALKLPAIEAAIRSDAAHISSAIDTFSRNHVRNHLAAGMSAGETPLQLADRIEGFFGGRRDAALTQARNYVAQTLSASRHEVMQTAGFTHEYWLSSRGGGERRPNHIACEQYYARNPKPVGQPYQVPARDGGVVEMRYPRDSNAPAAETANCQCVSIGTRVNSGGKTPGFEMALKAALTRGFAAFTSNMLEH